MRRSRFEIDALYMKGGLGAARNANAHFCPPCQSPYHQRQRRRPQHQPLPPSPRFPQAAQVSKSNVRTGCVVGVPAVLQSCCSTVGSTPVFANQTCGCPFNAVFLPNETQAFFSCIEDNNQTGGCVGPAPNSASPAAVRPRWKVALVPLVLGVSLWAKKLDADKTSISQGSGVVGPLDLVEIPQKLVKNAIFGQGLGNFGLKNVIFGQGNGQIPAPKTQIFGQPFGGASRGLHNELT
ncbi:hypothetical protein B0H14DRAFT_3035473 [Mycena olivaceomarginata]|nr:hypothetical protein B0H14DRAFT_3035473 [Mycena olivaceomarginata]